MQWFGNKQICVFLILLLGLQLSGCHSDEEIGDKAMFIKLDFEGVSPVLPGNEGYFITMEAEGGTFSFRPQKGYSGSIGDRFFTGVALDSDITDAFFLDEWWPGRYADWGWGSVEEEGDLHNCPGMWDRVEIAPNESGTPRVVRIYLAGAGYPSYSLVTVSQRE